MQRMTDPSECCQDGVLEELTRRGSRQIAYQLAALVQSSDEDGTKFFAQTGDTAQKLLDLLQAVRCLSGLYTRLDELI